MEEKHILFELKKLLKSVKKNITILCDNNLTANQNYVLGYVSYSIKKDEDIFQKDIEKKLKIKRSTATEILQNMESKELIKRVSVPQDKRLKKIILGSKGIELDKNIEKTINELEQNMSKNIDKKDLDIFYKTIEKMNDNLKEDKNV